MSGYPGPPDPFSDEIQAQVVPTPEDELWEEEMLRVDYVTGFCYDCLFLRQETFFAGDGKDLEDAKEKLRRRHEAQNPRCPNDLEFG